MSIGLLVTNKRKLNFGFNITINESVMSAYFGNPRSRNCELRPKTNRKKRQFLGRNVINFEFWRTRLPGTSHSGIFDQ